MQRFEYTFDVDLDEAKRIQHELRERVVLEDTTPGTDAIRYVGGADVAFLALDENPRTPYDTQQSIDSQDPAKPRLSDRRIARRATHAFGGVVVWDMMRGEVVETATAVVPVSLPYIPGFLSFREGPAVLAALGELSRRPEVMVYDGCGIAHPRGLGIASHLSVITGIPGIGCAKSKLCGTCEEPGAERGEWTGIEYRDRIVGACLRTRTEVKPVFVSPGSGCSIGYARTFVLALATRYRLPEPTRLAHQLVTREKSRYTNAPITSSEGRASWI